MSGFPQIFRIESAPAPILSGAPLSSLATWMPLGTACNWLLGSGAEIIPASAARLANAEISSGSTSVYNFTIAPRAVAIERIWCFQLVGRTTETGAEAEVWADSGTHVTIPVPNSGIVNPPMYYRQVLSAQSSTVAHVTFNAKATKQHVTVVGLSCTEQWRPFLAEAAPDYGVNVQSLRPRQPVGIGSSGNQSVGGIYTSLTNCDARRSGIFHFSVPDTAPVTRAGAYTSVVGLGMPVLARKLTTGATTGTVYWTAYAKVNSNSGDIKIGTSHSGVADSVNVTSTSYAWTTPRAIAIDCEDMAAADGRQATSWDELDVLIRGNSGGTLSLAAVSIYEKP